MTFSVADATATVLRREILAGKHYSGEQLRETQLAARLQVSRNTIRQAYRKLESEGLLTHIPHHGVFIASFDKERIRELYAFRHVAECGTLRSLSKSQAKLLGKEILSLCGSQSSLNLPNGICLSPRHRQGFRVSRPVSNRRIHSGPTPSLLPLLPPKHRTPCPIRRSPHQYRQGSHRRHPAPRRRPPQRLPQRVLRRRHRCPPTCHPFIISS